jgi:redox-sensitive bicupin YhaK (pirin superfamily)
VITHDILAGRQGWVQIASGSVHVNEIKLSKGDGLAIEKAGTLVFDKGQDAEILFFNLAH